ncbi:hypothetical protein [uncultured Gilliamella sp.]|uniref:hypothetical protein n=1 Tax=uncultured Gilliamella sp. TaxID=1193505 RepID=UPI0025F799BB|nr:hypothetical protein [uncultured Gilliamella sp.]
MDIPRVNINKRPKTVDKTGRTAGFEVDTIIGSNRKQTLVSVVERKPVLALINKEFSKNSRRDKGYDN